MMATEDVLKTISEYVSPETIFVSSLGRTSEEMFRYFPEQTLFLDSMGDVTSIACGLALGVGKDHNVVAVDTDGSQLMGLSVLPSVGSLAPKLPNLLLLVLDNEVYESAGGLPSRTVQLNWRMLGQSCGIETFEVDDAKGLHDVMRLAFTRMLYVVIKIHNFDMPSPSRKSVDGIESKYRFARHLERVIGRNLIMPAIKS